jgi:hypothetical protein
MPEKLIDRLIAKSKLSDEYAHSGFIYKNREYSLSRRRGEWHLVDFGERPEYLHDPNVGERGVIYAGRNELQDVLEHAVIDGRTLCDILSHYEEEYGTEINPIVPEKYSFDRVKDYLRRDAAFNIRIKLTEEELRSPQYKTKCNTKEIHYRAERRGDEWGFNCYNIWDFEGDPELREWWVPEPEGVTPLPQNLTTDQLIEFLGEKFFIRGRSFRELCDNYDKQDLIDLHGLG